MNDYGKSVLEQYELETVNVRRGRGCLLVEDGDGHTYRLAEYNGSKVHLELEQEVMQYLAEDGSLLTERCIPNRDGCLYSLNREQTGYVLRYYMEGTECSTSSQNDLNRAMRALAQFHLLMERFQGTPVLQKECFIGQPLGEEYIRCLRQMRRVYTYLRQKKKKNEYEHCLEDTIGSVISQGERALTALNETDYGLLYAKSAEQGLLCHGRYHYHHVRFSPEGTVLTGLEHCCVQVQVADLCQFLRKVLEKCSWSQTLGIGLIAEYEAIRPLSKEEREILSCMLAFPEKYYKQANFYYNTRKTWISPKNLEKLEKAVDQQEIREEFAKQISH